MDETSIRKRHRYVTVLVYGDTGEVLAMVPHRNAAALSAFLAAQGHKWCKGVKVVVSDGSKAYKAAIEARLGHTRHVLDRFHVVRWFAAGLTAVRRDVQRRPEGSKAAFDPGVFGARFLGMRRPDKLDAVEPTGSPTTPTSKPAACYQPDPRRAQQPESQKNEGSGFMEIIERVTLAFCIIAHFQER